MSNQSLMYLVGAIAAVFSIAAYVAFVLVPAVTSYRRWYERVAAGFVSLYVLAAFALIGVAVGAAFFWFSDRL